jgi:hypothetical protein
MVLQIHGPDEFAMVGNSIVYICLAPRDFIKDDFPIPTGPMTAKTGRVTFQAGVRVSGIYGFCSNVTATVLLLAT